MVVERINKLKVYNLVSPGVFYDYELIWRYQKSLSEQSYNSYKTNQQKLLSAIDHNNSLNSIHDSHDSNSLSNHTDYLIFVQHSSIYTLGKGGTTNNLRFSSQDKSKHKVVRVERGYLLSLHHNTNPNITLFVI